MTSITLTEVLDYYDGVLVFTGTDHEGSIYLGAVASGPEEPVYYVVVPVTEEQLSNLRDGTADLRSALLTPGSWYLTDPDDNSEIDHTLTPQSGNLDETPYLPGPGLYVG